MELINGGIYKRGVFVFALIFINIDQWAMLHICGHAINGMSCPIFQHNKEGVFIFTEDDLKKDWDSDNWILLDGRLRIEKIDPEMRMVDYPRGYLKPMKIKEDKII